MNGSWASTISSSTMLGGLPWSGAEFRDFSSWHVVFALTITALYFLHFWYISIVNMLSHTLQKPYKYADCGAQEKQWDGDNRSQGPGASADQDIGAGQRNHKLRVKLTAGGDGEAVILCAVSCSYITSYWVVQFCSYHCRKEILEDRRYLSSRSKTTSRTRLPTWLHTWPQGGRIVGTHRTTSNQHRGSILSHREFGKLL